MEIFELAAALGKKLKEDARITRLEEARAAYESDETIMTLSTEYMVQQQAMQMEAMKDEADRDEAAVEAISARVEELYSQLIEVPAYKAFEAAQNEVTELMTRVNDTINAQLMDGQPENCTHNCSTCGGCH